MQRVTIYSHTTRPGPDGAVTLEREDRVLGEWIAAQLASYPHRALPDQRANHGR